MVMLPRELEPPRLRIEARRRGVSIAELVREAERHPPASLAGQPLSFVALGDGGPPDASGHVDDYVADASRPNA